jgi:hypothetical protein
LKLLQREVSGREGRGRKLKGGRGGRAGRGRWGSRSLGGGGEEEPALVPEPEEQGGFKGVGRREESKFQLE